MNQIETTRRAMYSLLAELKPLPHIQGQASVLHEFEQAMEDHLEALRKEIVQLKQESDEIRADRSKYRQWMRSAVRQNRAERQNVKASRETQDELVAQIARLQRELAWRMAPERSVDVFASGSTFIQGQSIGCHPIPAYSAPQEPKQ